MVHAEAGHEACAVRRDPRREGHAGRGWERPYGPPRHFSQPPRGGALFRRLARVHARRAAAGGLRQRSRPASARTTARVERPAKRGVRDA